MLAVLLAGAVAGCGGSGPALVDSSTSAPPPSTAAAAPSTTRPGTTAVPTTGAIPSPQVSGMSAATMSGARSQKSRLTVAAAMGK